MHGSMNIKFIKRLILFFLCVTRRRVHLCCYNAVTVLDHIFFTWISTSIVFTSDKLLTLRASKPAVSK